MIVIVEDLLRDFIKSRLNATIANPDIIDEVFGYSNTEFIAASKRYITNTEIRVTLGYPRDRSSIPCYCILLGQENEETGALGDVMGSYLEDEIPANFEGGIHSGTVFGFNYRIECWSENGDLSVFMYHLLKYFVLKGRVELSEFGLISPTITGGDIEPLTDLYPSFVYRRAFILSGKVDNTFVSERNTGRIERIEVEGV